mmetsp:Transcript_32627/g.53031  ORF Transcript_32627/g.53031 Transcript_32627/m.53031 type:complete len:170 (-) Transcript_32627:92-601(-)
MAQLARNALSVANAPAYNPITGTEEPKWWVILTRTIVFTTSSAIILHHILTLYRNQARGFVYLLGFSFYWKVYFVMIFFAIYGLVSSIFIFSSYLIHLHGEIAKKKKEKKTLEKEVEKYRDKYEKIQKEANKIHVSYPMDKLVEKFTNIAEHSYVPGVLQARMRRATPS